jgi:hypothetical protein
MNHLGDNYVDKHRFRPETDIPEKVSLSVNAVNKTLFDFLIK